MLTESVTARSQKKTYRLSGKPLALEDFAVIAAYRPALGIELDHSAATRVSASWRAVDNAVKSDKVVYGLTTGFGGMANQSVDCHIAGDLQNNLLSFLAAGAGNTIESRHVRGAMALRANVLLQGCSGIRFELIERLVQFLQADATPVVRELGSIGASGDLVPLATIARAITGVQGKALVRMGGETIECREALERLELEPIALQPKEGLALVNGTSFSAAIAANAVWEAKNLFSIALATQVMMLRSLLAKEEPFESFVHGLKPHPGQVWTAKIVKQLLNDGCQELPVASDLVQDRYSLRCLPQYLGSIFEGLARIQTTVETEMNSVSDNPLVDPDTGQFYQSGNFLGQYVGIAMDDLRKYIGLTAKHLDVQIASLVTPEFSGGLPASLRGNDDVVNNMNMGLKGLQICGNSIMPMLTWFGNPMVDQFPTHAEQFNQNINGLSWGASHAAWKSVELFRHYLSIALIFSVQALDLRAKQVFGDFDGRRLLGAVPVQVYTAVCKLLDNEPGPDRPFLFDDSDRWLEQDVDAIGESLVQNGPIVESIQPILKSFDNNLRSGA
ncbi:MAG: aromatic amino acid ammonia-lyase [Planctomycetota bacterium]|nr:aromatic amino acid ammonia-lyase [Planctomycetota bacterium]